MRVVVKLEFIGENYFAYKRSKSPDSGKLERLAERLGRDKSRPWVARISGFGEHGNCEREFVRGQIDYSQVNSTGSRGVYLYYPLKTGLYEINERTSWTRVRRYFLLVEDMIQEEISREEAEQWLQSNLLA